VGRDPGGEDPPHRPARLDSAGLDPAEAREAAGDEASGAVKPPRTIYETDLEWCADAARELETAQRESDGHKYIVKIPDDLAREWARRLRGIAGE